MPSAARADADEAASTLLLLYEVLGIKATVLIEDEAGDILVLCQNTRDALPMCRKVIKEYEVPADRSLQ